MKYFTLKEANATLPLVKKIVEDILNTGKELRILAVKLYGKVDNSTDFQNLLSKLNNYLDELVNLGCYYKDWNFEMGLVDFPAKINDREVMLCWRSDEPSIKYYHGIDDGFAGRKAVPEFINQ